MTCEFLNWWEKYAFLIKWNFNLSFTVLFAEIAFNTCHSILDTCSYEAKDQCHFMKNDHVGLFDNYLTIFWAEETNLNSWILTHDIFFRPHRCPDPMNKNSAPTNFAARIFQRSVSWDVPPLHSSLILKSRNAYRSRFKFLWRYQWPDYSHCYRCC